MQATCSTADLVRSSPPTPQRTAASQALAHDLLLRRFAVVTVSDKRTLQTLKLFSKDFCSCVSRPGYACRQHVSFTC